MTEEVVSSSEDDEDEDVQVARMLRQREGADLNNEEYSQLELEDYMMSEGAQLALFLSHHSVPEEPQSVNVSTTVSACSVIC